MIHDAPVAPDATRPREDTVVERSGEGAMLVPLLHRVSERARSHQRAEHFRRRAEEILSLATFDAIVGSHPSMQDLLKRVAYVASTRATVLIQGESGTGKELIAAALHRNSKRREGPYVRLNCASLAESVLESELFGHEKGAFTGAATRREGRFRQADGGTLLLDEISEIPASIQVKLLRFLQEREFERVGGNESLRVDVRVLASANRDLKGLVRGGRFREDLYYRLAVVRLDVPPLRARPSDIVPLAQQFLRRAAMENEVEVTGFTRAAERALMNYPWPGNVRELQNAVEHAVILAESELVDAEQLPIQAQDATSPPQLMIPGVTLAELERYAITETLKAVSGSPAKAAKLLGVSRRTIQYRMREYGLSAKAAVGVAETPDHEDE
jgi:two-component system response regulator HydG